MERPLELPDQRRNQSRELAQALRSKRLAALARSLRRMAQVVTHARKRRDNGPWRCFQQTAQKNIGIAIKHFTQRP